MSTWSRREAFTLIEVLIIAIVIAVLAATILPLFSSSNVDARDSVLKFNLHVIRSQIEMYKMHHEGDVPALERFVEQMTEPTNAEGSTSGKNRIYGPYFQGSLPANPFNGSHALAAVAAVGVVPTAAVPGDAGWQYDPTTGGFYPNNPEYFAE